MSEKKNQLPNEKKNLSTDDELEGEGSRSADEKYRNDVEEFIDTDDVEKRGREAKEAIESDPDGYREAEEAGKKRIAEEDPEVRR